MMPSELQSRIDAYYKRDPNKPIIHFPRELNIVRHYDDCIAKGMSPNRAYDLAIEDLNRCPWHKGSKERQSHGSQVAFHKFASITD